MQRIVGLWKSGLASWMVRRSLRIPVLTFITVWVITACSAIGKTTLQGNELSACSPDLHFINHSVICENADQGWVGCQVNGSLENQGTAPVTNVIVAVEFGQVLNGMRSATYNVIGNLNPGEKADFKNSFSYYLHLTDYDIKIDCDQAVHAQPSPVPTPVVSFTNLGPQEEVTTLAIDPTTPTTLYAGTLFHGVFKSVDGGYGWTPTNTGMRNVHIGALVIDPLQPDILYAGTYGDNGTNGAAYKSVDGGSSWAEITNGMGGAYVLSLAMDAVASSTLYAGTSDGVFKTVDAGEAWTRLDIGDPDPYIPRVIVDPLTPTNVYAISSGTIEGILKSTNGGADWDLKKLTPDFFYPVVSLVIDPSTPTTVYAGTDVGVFKSTDSGETWNAINTGIAPYPDVTALIIDPETPSTLYVSVLNFDIFVTRNGGESWTALDSNLHDVPVWDFALDPVDRTILYADTQMGVFVLGR